jgi:hypothetical protein
LDLNPFLIGRAIGFELEHVIECVHVFDGRPDINPLELWLGFGKSRWLHLRAAADGESLSIDEEEPTDSGYSMGESGQIEYRNSTQTKRFQQWSGQRLDAAWTGVFEPGRPVAGLRLQLGNREPLVVFNGGDELYIRTQYPPATSLVETPVRGAAGG